MVRAFINGAAVMPDVEINDRNDMIRLPNMNPEYKYLISLDGLAWASKDAKEYVLALAVDINGNQMSGIDAAALLDMISESREVNK